MLLILSIRLKLDMQDKADSPLIETAGECSLCLFNMIIFGMATPYLHNGTLNIEDENGEVCRECSLLYKSMGKDHIPSTSQKAGLTGLNKTLLFVSTTAISKLVF